MSNRARVLLIEDNPGDVRLVREMLRSPAEPGFELEIAERLGDGLRRLSDGDFDVLLLDLSLPDSQGLETLLRVQASTPRIPMVVMTGTDDVDLAIRAVQAGAQDYLVKGRVDGNLLARSIRYAVERKRVEAALVASQKLLHDITDSSASLIYALDATGRFMLINRRLESVLGVPRETLIGKAREVILPPDIAAAHRANDLRVITERLPITLEEENDEPGGKRTYLSVKFPLVDGDGHVYGIGGNSTDITESKRARELIKSQLEELHRWQDVMLGREDRLQELKREVNELSRRAGEADRYSSQEAGPPSGVPGRQGP